MNPYDIPDRPIPSWVDNYDDKPHICPECGCEINETIYIIGGVTMYKIKAEGKEYYSDTLVYVKKAPNGCYVPCLPEEAEYIVGKVPEDTIFENAEVENFDGGSIASDMQEALNIMGVN